jgi:hypothetical protein
MAYPLPPLHFWHRIVQREGEYRIQSVCLTCGEQKIASLTEDLVRWERSHRCGPAHSRKEQKSPKP